MFAYLPGLPGVWTKHQTIFSGKIWTIFYITNSKKHLYKKTSALFGSAWPTGENLTRVNNRFGWFPPRCWKVFFIWTHDIPILAYIASHNASATSGPAPHTQFETWEGWTKTLQWGSGGLGFHRVDDMEDERCGKWLQILWNEMMKNDRARYHAMGAGAIDGTWWHETKCNMMMNWAKAWWGMMEKRWKLVKNNSWKQK